MRNALIFCLGCIFFFLSCKKEDDDTKPSNQVNNPESTNLNVYLTDAPCDYKAVYIDIEEVEVLNTANNSGGWKPLNNINPGIYNLLDFNNGTDTLLGSSVLPAGRLLEIRLILGSDNFLVLKNDDSTRLKTPSAQQSGLKIKINDSLKAGIDYDLILDFDVCKSIVKAGNSGKYNLKPVIRAFVEANSGSIAGAIIPDSVKTSATAVLGVDSFATYSGTNGEFLIRGLQAGTYDVYIEPDTASGFNNQTISGVTVIKGFVNDLGPIQL